MSKKKGTRVIIFISLLIVVGLVGWALFLFDNITGEVILKWQHPVESIIGPNKDSEAPQQIQPSPLPEFTPPAEEISECGIAKSVRKFVCDFYELNYPKGCNFWSGRCKAMREMCELAWREIDDKCGLYLE